MLEKLPYFRPWLLIDSLGLLNHGKSIVSCKLHISILFLYKSLFLKDLFIHIPAHERYNVRCKRIDMKEREFHMFYHLLTQLKSKLAFTESSVSQQSFYFNTVGMKRHPGACDSWHLALCIRKMTSSHGLVGPASLLPGPYGIHYFYHRKATRLLKT